MQADFNTILERHAVDVRKALAEFREASARRHDTSAQEYHFDNNVPNHSSVQKRLSIYNWNPGPRRGREGAIEKQIAGKWHIITLQEAIEYVDHELFMNRFHMTHYGGCAVIFNKDTFFPDVKVKSIYLQDTRRVLPDKVVEGDSGWVLQGVLSRASFRRQPPSGQKTFTVLSLHNKNNYAKKRGIGKKLILTIHAVMLDEKVDLVACDFNEAAWRRENSNHISIVEKAFADCALPMPPGSTPLWVQEWCQVRGQTCVDFSSPRNSLRARLRPLDSYRDRKVESGEQVKECFNINERVFHWMVMDSQPTKSVPRRVRLVIERNIDEMYPKRNQQSRMQNENLDVRGVGATRPLRGVALFDETCDLTDEDAQEATVRACRSVNPGIIIVGIPRTAPKSHFEFCMTLCTWQHERGALYIMILTDSEDALSKEQFLALEALHRSEASAFLGRDLRQVGTGA